METEHRTIREGDIVRIRFLNSFAKEFGSSDYRMFDVPFGFNGEMAEYCGKYVRIAGGDDSLLLLENIGYSWSKEMIDMREFIERTRKHNEHIEKLMENNDFIEGVI
jgi:hypothetical protein